MQKFVSICTDNAKVRKLTAIILHFSWFGCFPHTLNLVIKDGFKNACIQELINIRAIASYCKRSAKACDALNIRFLSANQFTISLFKGYIRIFISFQIGILSPNYLFQVVFPPHPLLSTYSSNGTATFLPSSTTARWLFSGFWGWFLSPRWRCSSRETRTFLQSKLLKGSSLMLYTFRILSAEDIQICIFV